MSPVFARFGLMPSYTFCTTQYWTMSSNDHLSCKMLVCSAWALLTMVTSKPPCRHHTSGKVSNKKSLSKGTCSNRTSVYCFCPRIKQIIWDCYFRVQKKQKKEDEEVLDSVQLALNSRPKLGILEAGWILKEMLSNWQGPNEPWSWSGHKRQWLPVSTSKKTQLMSRLVSIQKCELKRSTVQHSEFDGPANFRPDLICKTSLLAGVPFIQSGCYMSLGAGDMHLDEFSITVSRAWLP